ncbi:ATP-binding protein [Bacillus sp. DNRA2]|nr:ATP-binding protein [Bacillus sp. DNRA2]
MDFNFINAILDIKISGTVGKKDKVKTIYGTPLQAFSKMVINTLMDNRNIIGNISNDDGFCLEFIVKSVTFADTLSNDEDKYDKWSKLCLFTNGLLEYLNEEIEDKVPLKYEDNAEFFNLKRFANVNINAASSNIKLSNILFEIKINEEKKHNFKWVFNTNDFWYRTFIHLDEINKKLEEESLLLPIFYAKGLGSLLECNDKESFHFQLIGKKIGIINTLTTLPDEVRNGLLFSKMIHLVKPYENFVSSLFENGLYNSINPAKSDSAFKFINTYIKVVNEISESINDLNAVEKEHLNLIANLFYIVANKDVAEANLKLEGAIIPPYHPAMLEKLIEQQSFQRRGIGLVIKEILENEKMSNTIIENKIVAAEKQSTIISSVDTIISEMEESRIPKKVFGYYALHGEITSDIALDINSMLDADLVFDEDFDTKEMISDTALSRLITEQINEYVRTYPAHTDSIRITFLNFSNLQPVIAGLHGFVNKLGGINHKIHLRLQIFAQSGLNQGRNYVNYWLDNFFTESDPVNIETYFNDLNLQEISLIDIEGQLFESDITFLENILKTNGIVYERTGEKSIEPSETRFPMVFHPIPVLKKNLTKNISISQKQFQASYYHTQLLHWIERPHSVKDTYRIEKELVLPEKMIELMDLIHKKSRWLVTLDSGLDKAFLKEENVISFSTGEGTFGELNMTVSSRPEVKSDLEVKLTRRLKALFPSWSNEMCRESAKYCIEQSHVLDGMKVLKALNPHDYEIHSFLSSLLSFNSMEINSRNENEVINNYISLDSYKHWFYGEPNRPDFLKIEINKQSQEDMVVIDATLVECKMAKYNEVHINKGIQQLSNGVAYLMDKFNPSSKEYNRRYWFSQLYRMLAFSTMNISESEKENSNMNQHLLKILEGKFKINWDSVLITYWLDYNGEIIEERSFCLEGTGVNCKHLSFGQLYVQTELLPSDFRNDVSFEDPTSLEMSLVADDEFVNDVVLNDNIDKLKDRELEKERYATEKELINKQVIKQTASKENNDGNRNQINLIEFLENQHVANNQDGLNNITNTNSIEENEKTTSSSSEKNDNKETTNLENIRILLGEEHRTKRKIYWEYGHPQLENRHILISGKSGVGKTYFMQCLLLELARNNISSIIFDYTDGFKKSKLEPEFKVYLGEKVEQFHIQLNKFPINPFKKNQKEIDEDLFKEEEDTDVAERIKDVFAAVYDTGPQQANSIYRATMKGLEKYGNQMNLRYLKKELELDGSSYSKTVLSRIEPLIDRNPFDSSSEYNWDKHREKKGIVFVVQLSGFTREMQLIVTEFILWDLWNYNLSHGDKSKPFPVILDEAQNLDHSENSPSAKILTEGRKFGWSGWFATQFMQGQLHKDEIQRLQNASQKIYFSPPETEINDIASFLSTDTQKKKEWAKRLANLPKGQCIVAGPVLRPDGNLERNTPMVINVTPLRERI